MKKVEVIGLRGLRGLRGLGEHQIYFVDELVQKRLFLVVLANMDERVELILTDEYAQMKWTYLIQ
jgi:hypothetical protein